MTGPVTEYRRIHHAAHYGAPSDGGHDLEEWDIVGSDWTPAAGGVPAHVAFPAALEGVNHRVAYHHGYIDGNLRQHWVFTRRATFGAGTCSSCR